jgi:hypothetical protein
MNCNYSGARSQNSGARMKKLLNDFSGLEKYLDYGDTLELMFQLEEVSRLREACTLLFWILAPDF